MGPWLSKPQARLLRDRWRGRSHIRHKASLYESAGGTVSVKSSNTWIVMWEEMDVKTGKGGRGWSCPRSLMCQKEHKVKYIKT